MAEQNLESAAVEHVRQRLGKDGPPEQRIVHWGAHDEWDETLLRRTSQHTLQVLGREADIIVYFDQTGNVIGWRDDGRKGTEMPGMIDPEVFLKVVVRELHLPETTHLGQIEPAKLPPLGWTHQAVLFLAPTPTPDQILRVWADPKTLKVIQCLRGPVSGTGTPAAAKDGQP